MSCEACGGTGRRYVKRDGYDYSAPCPVCAAKRDAGRAREPAPTIEEAYAAVAALTSVRIHGFPRTDLGQRMVAEYLQKSARSRSDLAGITSAAITGLSEWKGLVTLGLLISNYRERRAAEADTREAEQKLIEWKREQKLLTGDDSPRPEIPGGKLRSMPDPKKRVQNGD